MAGNSLETPRSTEKAHARTARGALLVLVFVILSGTWGGGSAQGAVNVVGIRHSADGRAARVTFTLDRETLVFRAGVLENPTRVFLDIPGGRLGRGVRTPAFKARRSIVSSIRFGKPARKFLRVVVDVPSARRVEHRVFTLPRPPRIVLDLWAKRAPERKAAKPAPAKRAPRTARGGKPGKPIDPRELTLAERFRRGLGVIVIDPAHGGKDPGAVGVGGLKEKDIALDLSFRLRRVLRRALPRTRIHLTRETDKYITLAGRTAFANKKGADLFVSIHANSAPSRRVHGIETFYLNEASSKRALRLAARENKVTVAQMSDLSKILHGIGQRWKVQESRQLARLVQRAMVARVRARWRGVKSLGVKRAPFYVLIGAWRPSILVEVGFVSNAREARRMRDRKYRQALAEGIARGMMRFVGVGPRNAKANASAR